MKDKNSIINEMVLNSADVMEAKARELKLIASVFLNKGEVERAAMLDARAQEAMQAVEIIRRNAGGWV